MFWAHYDDDLVFANPTLLHALESGRHAHSCFITASDAGAGMSAYVDGRERGIRAAYDTMRGARGTWSDRPMVLGNGVGVTLTRPDDDERVSLSFLRLPDGGLRGIGYASTGWQSLAKLVAGELPALRTLDTGQPITVELLRSTVVELVVAYGATTVITHEPGFADLPGDDHPDHQSVGRVVASAVDAGAIDGGVMQYAVGYPAALRPANITADVLARKLQAFASYARHDPVVAREEPHEYLLVRGFGEWLQRHYLVTHDELVRLVADADEVATTATPHAVPHPDSASSVPNALPTHLAPPVRHRATHVRPSGGRRSEHDNPGRTRAEE